MNWKILLVSIITVILIGSLVAFQIIGIDLGIVPLIIGVIGIIAPILNNLRKPKSSLQIKDPEFEKREYGNYRGYKIIIHVVNRGRKIIHNLEASIKFKEQMNCLIVRMSTTNELESIEASNYSLNEKEYSWIDNKGKDTKKNLISELRKYDPIKAMFPKEKTEFAYALGSIDGSTDVFGSSSDILLKLEPQKTYNLIIELKGEDKDKITVTQKKKLKIKLP